MRIPNWYRVDANGLRFYQAWNLHASGLVTHGFSARMGGVGSAPFDTLNLGYGTNDDPAAVTSNRRAFAEALQIDPARLVVPQQAHSGNVRRVDESDAGSGALSYAAGIPETDALITSVPNLPLALHFADCVCVFLLDPANGAIGAVHAGWRGTVQGVVTNTIDAMRKEFDTDPKLLLAAIGPAICRHCYDVDEDVAREFFGAYPHDERVMKQSGSAKWRVDLKRANLILLESAGVEDANVALSDECTSCNREEFFSHRRDGGETGRMGGWMCLI
jgi:YfiH family protein